MNSLLEIVIASHVIVEDAKIEAVHSQLIK